MASRFGKLKAVALLLATATLAGCSAQQWYEGMRASERLACNRQPGEDARRCAEKADTRPDYDKYEKQRGSAY